MSRRRIALLPVLLLLLVPSAAHASTVTIGDPFTTTPGTSGKSAIEATLFNVSIAEPGGITASPANGAIVRWRLRGAEGGPFRLRILRPSNGGAAYTAVGTSSAGTALSLGVETFPTAMPIQAGDIIALDVVKGVKLGAILNPASVIGAFSPIFVEGATQAPLVVEKGVQFVFNADVQPAPSIASLKPAKGSFKGGAKVKITGADFTGVSAVTLGGVPVKRFTVDSETQISAVMPALKKPVKAEVAITTNAGTSLAGAPTSIFKGTACVVPKLKTKSLKAAKKQLRKAECKLGKLTKRGGVSAKTGKVVKQKPGPGKKLAPGAKVTVTIG